MHKNLGVNTKITRGINAMSSASTTVGNELDMAGFEGVLYISIGSSLMEGSGTMSLKAAGSTASGGTFVPYSVGSGSTVPVTASFDSKILALDVHKPLKRYIKPIIAGASSDVMHTRAVVAIQYSARTPGSSDVYLGSSLVGNVVTIVGATSS